MILTKNVVPSLSQSVFSEVEASAPLVNGGIEYKTYKLGRTTSSGFNAVLPQKPKWVIRNESFIDNFIAGCLKISHQTQ